MSVVDWVCKKISLESASERLSAITISRQQVLPSKLDACANVTTCCWWQLLVYAAGACENGCATETRVTPSRIPFFLAPTNSKRLLRHRLPSLTTAYWKSNYRHLYGNLSIKRLECT